MAASAAALWKSQVFRFLVIGVCNTIFGYGVYVICIFVGLHYQAAVVVSTIVGVIFNFFTTGMIVFDNASLARIFGFVAVYGLTMIANIALLTLLVHMGVSDVFGQMLLLPFIVSLSFLLNKFLVFRK